MMCLSNKLAGVICVILVLGFQVVHSFLGGSPFQQYISSQAKRSNRISCFSNGKMNLRMMADEFDPIIDAMNSASSSELPNLVAKEVKKVASPQFFMAIADKADKASTEEDKEKLNKLANEVTQILEELLKVAENQMDKASKVVEAIVVSAAEKDGQFLVPLSAERKQAMKQVVEQFSEELDDNFLSTVSTWMNKAQEDKMDGMVQILQRVLQLYAANALQIGVKSVSGTAPESSVFFR
mmetsp:Transcript_4715/g.6204  ORF Transcript_4715/g.6204 Transcript_4715/m.6204 type:complete len:239 (-) Transcript_4715:607-1323(-)